MNGADSLLQFTSHRSWPLPAHKWKYYQEWNNALFLHWRLPLHELSKFLPPAFKLDSYEQETWLSLVAFTMEKVRPRFLPPFPPISDFHEINVRIYATRDDKPGVFFLSIEAEKGLSALIARLISGLPYQKAGMTRNEKNSIQNYHSQNQKTGFLFDAEYHVGKEITTPSALEKWLTERYCLYLINDQGPYRYEIHHQPWKLYEVDISKLTTTYHFDQLTLSKPPDMAHYSDGVRVIAWDAEKLR